jgi:hypothetical protein
VIVRSIKNYDSTDPARTIHTFLQNEGTETARELARKAVVLLEPLARMGEVVWYKGPISGGAA